MRRYANLFLGLVLAVCTGIVWFASPAQASDYALRQCNTTTLNQLLPASLNYHSTQYSVTGGFRSCSFQGRWHIRMAAVGCGWFAGKPELNIIQDTGLNAGDRTKYDINCDTTYNFWNAAYPNPNDSNNNWYHVHVHEQETTPDADFDNMNIRIG